MLIPGIGTGKIRLKFVVFKEKEKGKVSEIRLLLVMNRINFILH